MLQQHRDNSEKFTKFRKDRETLRRHATVTGPKNKRTITIDISKFEFCDSKKEYDLEGYTIYVYTPEMIVFEKIRAICQQMVEYGEVVAIIPHDCHCQVYICSLCV